MQHCVSDAAATLLTRGLLLTEACCCTYAPTASECRPSCVIVLTRSVLLLAAAHAHC